MISVSLRSADQDIQMESYQHKIFHINPLQFEIFPLLNNHGYPFTNIKVIRFLPNAGKEIGAKDQNFYHVDPLEGYKEIIIDAANTSMFIFLRNQALEKKKFIRFETEYTTLNKNWHRRILVDNFDNALSIADETLPEANYHLYFTSDFMPSLCDDIICSVLCCLSCNSMHELIVFEGNEIKNYENSSWWQFFNNIHHYARRDPVYVLDLFITNREYTHTLDAKFVFHRTKSTGEMSPLLD